MKRMLSVWLPHWPIERLRRQTPGALPDDAPAALVIAGTHGLSVTAVNRPAARDGILPGTSLADARAALPALVSRPAELFADRRALLRLARWLGRYGPFRHVDGTDGLWVDITGVAHLWGGERALAADLLARLAQLGITARLGLADTLGAAHALARFATHDERALSIAARDETGPALARLPVDGLRLTPEAVLLLRRLGLKRIGQLYDLPRASLEQRFRDGVTGKAAKRETAALAGAVVLRLDQALGLTPEPRRPLREPPLLAVQRSWPEPLVSSEALVSEIGVLVRELATKLGAAGLGARAVALALYRADGTVAHARARFSRPSADANHMLGLLQERLATLDAGFGIDVVVLEAHAAERVTPSQSSLDHTRGDENAGARLADRIAGRLGPSRIYGLSPFGSHVPELAERRSPPSPRSAPPQRSPAPERAAAAGTWGRRPQRHDGSPRLDQESPVPAEPAVPRPHLLLAPPEPVAVMAEVPEGPPRRFTWRRVARAVVKAEGPERIAPEWWHELRRGSVEDATADDGDPGLGTLVTRPAGSRTRDYYVVEDETGARYWLYRDGLYGEAMHEAPPRWFLHGLF